MTDPIADLLTRIRNAHRARHQVVNIPSSKLKVSILKILKDEGFISHYVVQEQSPQNEIKIFLKYDMDRKPAIHRLKRISKPGGRIYQKSHELKPFLMGMGIRIISTPKGVITDKTARRNKVGGEVLCEVW